MCSLPMFPFPWTFVNNSLHYPTAKICEVIENLRFLEKVDASMTGSESKKNVLGTFLVTLAVGFCLSILASLLIISYDDYHWSAFAIFAGAGCFVIGAAVSLFAEMFGFIFLGLSLVASFIFSICLAVHCNKIREGREAAHSHTYNAPYFLAVAEACFQAMFICSIPGMLSVLTVSPSRSSTQKSLTATRSTTDAFP
eukprot:Blabericola_migrator_1__1301@NODE_1339_length_4765_cov_230_811622_g898_i0_p4_GENE_NODE_1339_length_4765_cov_230_811622_g898_i0NODE_1339_length_4765_cov_230_811622_g898_i0_p4_ORF_typecomplete_len197_score13_88DUF3533/PF12051_8/0_42Otopetrin/PF03189_13/0_52DUF2583/PF10762_9/0_43DUF2583/PF10762_9/1e03DUF543/PF04418_12/0_18DUF543/PF04418_12/2_1e03Kinocilin/PF15033_6/0_7DUF2070/PF09843_9/1_3Sre/PF03125_18/2_3DUF4870/PF09685_10/23DUF872/PF05915_12/0_51DUF872/PF05915_12/1_3e03_NODE_1339_length_4765_cov